MQSQQGDTWMERVRSQRKPAGFTMIELMVVVLIVALLAAIAIPIYGNYVKNARISEATGKIGEIATASRIWAQEHENSYGNPIWPSATHGLVDLGETDNFTYAIVGGGGCNAKSTPLVLQGTGKPDGKMAGVIVTITIPDLGSSSNSHTTHRPGR
jgi:type IV pilus assembly protein PilE